MPHDITGLMGRYQEIAVAVQAGSVPYDEALRMLDDLVVADAAGAHWRVDEHGNLYRAEPGGTWQQADPSAFVGDPNLQPSWQADGPAGQHNTLALPPPSPSGWDATAPPVGVGAPQPASTPAPDPLADGAADGQDEPGWASTAVPAPAPPRRKLPLRMLAVAATAVVAVGLGVAAVLSYDGAERAAPDPSENPTDPQPPGGDTDPQPPGGAPDSPNPPAGDAAGLADPAPPGSDESGQTAPDADTVRTAITAAHSGDLNLAAAAIDDIGSRATAVRFAAALAGWDAAGVTAVPGPLQPDGDGQAVQRWSMTDVDTEEVYGQADVEWVRRDGWKIRTWPSYGPVSP